MRESPVAISRRLAAPRENNTSPPSETPVVPPKVRLVPVKVKLASSVKAVAPEFVKEMRLAVYDAGVSVRPRNVVAPPPLKPRLEVATHCVPEPVVCKTIPAVPALLFLSRSAPVRKKSPATVSRLLGVVVPMPRLPELAIVIRTKLSVANCIVPLEPAEFPLSTSAPDKASAIR